MKTVKIEKLPVHHSGIEMGYMVESKVLPNCKRRVSRIEEANELAEYWEKIAKSHYNR